MSADDALWGSLTRLASEAGRLVRSAAEATAGEISGALGRDRQVLRWPSGLTPLRPTIPEPYVIQGRSLDWRDAYMAFCALPAAAALQRDGVQPVAVGLVAAQTVLHFRPGGYNLLQVGLNPHRVLHHGEWRRLGTSLVLHADLPHLVTNCTALLTDGLPLERRLGTVRFAALVATSAALTQALHLLATRAAVAWLPRSQLANSHFLAYGVGFSGVCMALRVIAGYQWEADLAAAGQPISEEFTLQVGRLSVWFSLLTVQIVEPRAGLVGHLCGVCAGVCQVYASAAWSKWRNKPRRRITGRRLAAAPRPGVDGHPRLGWMDLISHGLLAAATCVAAAALQRRRAAA